MAYKKKYYRKRQYKKNLSKSNIFGKKTAKSQAKQIYALNKKINYIRKTTSPETKTFENVLLYFDSLQGQNLITHDHRRLCLYKDRILNRAFTHSLDIDGDLLRVKKIYLYGMFALKDFRSRGYEVAGSSAVGYANKIDSYYNPECGYLRLTICRLIKASSNFPVRITSDLENIGNTITTSESIPVNTLIGPLKSGITSQLQIVKTKLIKLKPSDTCKAFKIKLSNTKKCNLNYRISSLNGAEQFQQGEIVVYVDYVAPVWLAVGQPAEYLGPRCALQINYKLVYSDDGTTVIDNP